MLEELKIEQVNEVSQMFLSVFKSEPFNFTWITEKKSLGYINDLFKDSGYKGFVYKIDDEIIGYCLGAYNRNMVMNQYHIKEIFIKPESQGKGYGKIMISEIEDYLKCDDIELISLYTNIGIPAYKFYLKNNFQVLEESVHMIKVIG